MIYENVPLTKSKHIALYDWARLFAIICVIVGHSAYLHIATKYGSISYDLPQNLSSAYDSLLLILYRRYKTLVYGFVLEFFFAISGAVASFKILPSLDKLCISKAKRLLLPYYLTGIFYMLPLKFIAGFYTKQNLLQAIKVFWHGDESGHLWFLGALFWCFIFFAILQKTLMRLNIKSKIVLLCLACLISVFHKSIPIDFLELRRGASYLVWFTLGYVLDDYRKQYNIEEISMKKLLIIFIVLAIFMTLYTMREWLDTVTFALCGIATFTTLSLIMTKVFSLYNLHLPKVLMRNLLCVYLFHDPLNYLILRFAFSKVNLLCSSLGCYLYYAMRTVGIFFVSLAIGEVLFRLTSFFCKVKIWQKI